MSSFLERDMAAIQGLGYDHLIRCTERVRTEKVPVRTLDSMFSQITANDPGARVFLKCDTQGYDLKVMAGARVSLASIPALQIELSFKPIYAGAPSYLEVMKHLNDAGFDVTGMSPVRRDPKSPIVNFDCVMINSRYPQTRAD